MWAQNADAVRNFKTLAKDTLHEAFGGIVMAPAIGGIFGLVLGAMGVFNAGFSFSGVLICATLGVVAGIAYAIWDLFG